MRHGVQGRVEGWGTPEARCWGTAGAGVLNTGLANTFHECAAFTVALQGPLWISYLLKEITCLLTQPMLLQRYPYYTKTNCQPPKMGDSASGQGGLCTPRHRWVGEGSELRGLRDGNWEPGYPFIQLALDQGSSDMLHQLRVGQQFLSVQHQPSSLGGEPSFEVEADSC